MDVHLKSSIEPKHKKVFVESFLKRIEAISAQLNELIPEQSARYIAMRMNWMSLIRTYVHRFDYMHIPLEDLKKYDEKTQPPWNNAYEIHQ